MSSLFLKLEALFRKATLDFQESIFDQQAFRLLSDLQMNEKDVDELLLEILKAGDLPRQNFGRHDFGHPGFTLFSDKRIALDIYIWAVSNVSIHSHNFSGAFKLIRGQSFQQTFNFVDRKPLLEKVNTGRLELKHKETINTWDVRLIEPEHRLIHSIYHLAKPSITLTLRTIGPATPLSMYIYPGLEVEHSKDFDLICLKKLDLLKVLGGDADILDSVPDLELGLIYHFAVEERAEAHILTKIEECLMRKEWGKFFRDNVKSHRVFNSKYRTMLDGKI